MPHSVILTIAAEVTNPLTTDNLHRSPDPLKYMTNTLEPSHHYMGGILVWEFSGQTLNECIESRAVDLGT
jgi:hypothetical protein